MYTSERPDKGTIVYVGNLESEVTKEQLEAEFGKFGALSRVWVAFNPPGFAFVEYDKKEDAESAVSSMHDAIAFGSKLRVEISRGRGRGSRGGPGGRGGRGSRGGRGDFGGGRGGDFGRGRGMFRGRGGFGRPAPYDIGMKPYRGGGFNNFEDGRRPEFADRDFGGPRDFSVRREFADMEGPRGFGPGRDFPPRDVDYPPRDSGRDFPPRDIGARDYPPRDMDGRDYQVPRGVGDRDFAGGRDRPRDFGPRDYGGEREVNGGMRGYGGVNTMGGAIDKGYGASRDYIGQAPIVRDYAARDVPPGPRDFGRDGAPPRDYDGLRRESGGVRDFNPPRDLADPRDFAGRPARLDYENDRFGGRGGFGGEAVRRPGAFEGGRYPAGEVGGTGDYGGYNRFRSRSPMGRGRVPY